MFLKNVLILLDLNVPSNIIQNSVTYTEIWYGLRLTAMSEENLLSHAVFYVCVLQDIIYRFYILLNFIEIVL